MTMFCSVRLSIMWAFFKESVHKHLFVEYTYNKLKSTAGEKQPFLKEGRKNHISFVVAFQLNYNEHFGLFLYNCGILCNLFALRDVISVALQKRVLLHIATHSFCNA